jgi:hypothetical protein
MEEHPVWATKDKEPAPDPEALKQTNAKALPGYDRDLQSLVDHLAVRDAERKGTREHSYTKRILLSPGESDKVPEGDGDEKNTARLHLLEAEKPDPTSRRASPIEVEIMPRRVENPSNKPEMAPTPLENYNQPRDSLHEQHPSNTSKIPPTLQVDSREDAQEEATSEACTKEPVITARGSLSSNSSIDNPKLEAQAKRAAKDAAKEAKRKGKRVVFGSAKVPRRRQRKRPQTRRIGVVKCESVVLEATNSELHHALKRRKKWRIFRPMRKPLLGDYPCCDELSCLNVTAIPERPFLNV